jgi:hypothetical protein
MFTLILYPPWKLGNSEQDEYHFFFYCDSAAVANTSQYLLCHLQFSTMPNRIYGDLENPLLFKKLLLPPSLSQKFKYCDAIRQQCGKIIRARKH